MPKRTYTPVEKMGLMWASISGGVPQTAKEHSVPETTIYNWFEEIGGMGAVRAYYEQLTHAAYTRSLRVLYETVAERLPRLKDNELMVTFRELMRERSDTPQAAGAASATAQIINVNINE